MITGHKNKKTLIRQVQEALEARLRIGESKHMAKIDGTAAEGIFSWGTYKSYLKHACYFAKYCKEAHGCKTLEECRPYVEEWIRSRSALSPYTQKLEAAALAKLYGCSTKDFEVQTPPRIRENITRSRGDKIRDKHFSEDQHIDLVIFARQTGLRRAELQALTGDKLTEIKGKLYIHVDSGAKGGRERYAPIIGNPAPVVAMMRAAGKGKVFPDGIPGGADIHGYRADYATVIYHMHARPLEVCKKESFYNIERHKWEKDSVYRMRGSKRGEWLDKKAMLAASKALGHNRISVVGQHYIR